MSLRSGRRWRRWLLGLAVLVLVPGSHSVAEPVRGRTPPPTPEIDEAASARVPFYLRDLDLSVPAPETFRGWPPEELRVRPYWLPWGWSTFQRASLFHRPIFFVLTVNWSRGSQALTHDLLSDPDVLRTVNQSYISTMVNADLRPDIRERYQTGVWPTVAFLLPNGNPMLSQANDLGVARPITTSTIDKDSMLFLLEEGAKYWKLWPGVLIDAGQTWLEREGSERPLAGEADATSSDRVTGALMAEADHEHGGFGKAAKYLIPGLNEYAGLRAARGLPALAQHGRLTLERLLASRLFDSREGGVHRLAARPDYEAIEYEKMLAGNSALIRELVLALREEESPVLREALESTAGFLLDTLGRQGGGFHHAQVADAASDKGGGYWTSRQRDESRRPPVDPIVLSGPNALAGAALLRAGLLLDDARVTSAGRAAIELVVASYRRGRGVIHAIEPAGDPRIYLSAQADCALGLLDAFEATGDRNYLEIGRGIVDVVMLNLDDPASPLFRDSLADGTPMGLMANPRHPLRPNIRLARAMLRLALHGQGDRYRTAAVDILAELSGDLSSFRLHSVEAGLAIEETIRRPIVVRLAGPSGTGADELVRAAINSPWAWTLVTHGDAGEAESGTAELLVGEQRRRVRDASELTRLLGEATRTEAP